MRFIPDDDIIHGTSNRDGQWTIPAQRVHRLQRVQSIASLRSSQNLRPKSEKTAATRRICVGLSTEAADRIGFVQAAGPM
jgi:hypothetical protein